MLVERPRLIGRCVSSCAVASMLAACVPSHRDQLREFETVIKRELAGGDSGRLCANVDEFPYPDSPHPAESYAEIHAMARAGIVEGYSGPIPDDGNAAVPSGKLSKLWRLTDENDPSFVRYDHSLLRNHGCYQYGRLRLVRIERWREFVAPDNEKVTTVFFTYRIDHLANWARDPELRQVAEDTPDSGGKIWPVVAGQNKEMRTIDLVATPEGWKARPVVYAPPPPIGP